MAAFVTFAILCAVAAAMWWLLQDLLAAAVGSFVKHRKEYGRN
jgi:hypothetical protein